MDISNQDILPSFTLSSKYGHLFSKNKIATVKMPISRRQNGRPQANGWRHGGSSYYLSYSLWTVVIFTIKGTLLNFWPLVVLWSNFMIFFCLFVSCGHFHTFSHNIDSWWLVHMKKYRNMPIKAVKKQYANSQTLMSILKMSKNWL